MYICLWHVHMYVCVNSTGVYVCMYLQADNYDTDILKFTVYFSIDRREKMKSDRYCK